MPTTLSFDDLRLECSSRAGDSTWLRVHPPGLAIDVGRGTTRLAGVSRIFLTHGHVDHSLGIPFLLSMRSGRDGPPLEIYCPQSIEPAVGRFIESAAELEDRQFDYSLEGLVAGDRRRVGEDLWIEAFETDHVVPCLGYHLVRRRHRLKRDLECASSEVLAELRHSGKEINESFEENWLSCTGDTSASIFESVPELFESRVLVVECTFLDARHEQRARHFKHIHLKDLVEVRERFANRALVLYHLSRRHRAGELRIAVRERLVPIVPEVHVVG